MTDRNERCIVEFARTAGDYARHRAGFPQSFFARLAAEGLVVPGAQGLDLGTGTGTVARGLARRGLVMTGLDPAPEMTAEATTLDRADGVDVAYVTAAAEATGLAGGAFDLVTAGQCWHWFERPEAAAEVLRLLQPGGHLVIAHFDWLPLPGNVVEASEALIQEFNPHWHYGGRNGVHGRWISDQRVAGFADVRSFSYDEPARYSHEAWRGRVRASAGIAASLPAARVAAFDAAHAEMLASRFPEDPLAVPHCIFAVIERKPG